MKNSIVYGLAAGLSLLAVGAIAETRQTATTSYNVITNLGEEVALPNGRKMTGNAMSHGTVVDDKTGEVRSQWCDAQQHPDSKGAIALSAGYCTAFSDNGDILWVSFVNSAADQSSTWTVMGGTGQNAGATGGGTCKLGSRRGDGYAWTNTCTGTITTK